MAADTRIEDVKTLLDAINADDVAEDAAFQATIDGLSISLAAVTAERDALLAEKATTLVDLRAILDLLTAKVTALESA
jgi:hypothetical protein